MRDLTMIELFLVDSLRDIPSDSHKESERVDKIGEYPKPGYRAQRVSQDKKWDALPGIRSHDRDIRAGQSHAGTWDDLCRLCSAKAYKYF
jgi:hypothetical protein